MSQMISDVGIFIIFILLTIRIICMTYLKFYQSIWVQKFISFGTYDRVCRIIQYTSSGLIGNNQPFVNNIHKQFNLHRYIAVNCLQQISSSMSFSRKILRFLRAPLTIKSLCKSEIQLQNFNWQKPNLNQVIQLNQWLGDFFDVLFYFTDHFSIFFLFGLVRSKQLEVKLEFIGHVAWVLNAWFYLCAALMRIYVWKNEKERVEQKQKIYKRSILEVISNWNQFILGFSFIYPRWLAREMISLLVIVSSASKLVKLKFD